MKLLLNKKGYKVYKIQKMHASFREAIKKLNEFILIDKSDIVDIFVFATMASVVGLTLPLGLQAIIGFFISGAFSASIVLLIFLIVIGTFVYGLLQIRQLQILQKLKQKIFYRFSMAYIIHIPKLDIEKSNIYNLPEMVNRFFDTLTLQKGYQKLLLDIPMAVIQIILGLVLLSFYHPLFIGFGFILVAVLYAILYYTGSKGYESGVEASDYKYKVAGWIEEVARIAFSFKFSQNKFHIKKQDELVSKHIEAKNKHFKVHLIQYWSLIGFKVIITAIMLILGAFLLLNEEINIGQFIAADIVIIAIMASIEKVIISVDTFYDSIIGLQKLQKVLKMPKEQNGSIIFDDKIGYDFEIENLNYSKPDSPLFRNLSTSFPSGSKTLILGNSGSGKSFLIKSLLGVYNDYEGQILLNVLSIKTYDLDSMRKKIAVFMDQFELFNGNILENITFLEDKSLAHITDILKIIGLEDFVNKLPEGLHFQINSNNNTLPTHIRKKILLCRTLLLDAKLYILENPFEFLDENACIQILEYLRHKEATVIITSYNDSYKNLFDKTIELK